ncbi:hypothetical protein ACN27F_09090 [Solwaraspora sp. WMMB335]|uniref:hypothetical protein n=1 Tax=Solwaraspora sp. WMMB335 TaxID=3404118 RepID=UPI003B926DAF
MDDVDAPRAGAEGPVGAEGPAGPRRPSAVLGQVVAGQLLLARSDRAAVILTSLLAYPTGFEFEICAILREPAQPEPAAGAVRSPDGTAVAPRPRTPVDGVGGLEVAVRFANGARATNLRRAPTDAGQPDGPVLVPLVASTDQWRHEAEFWVWPLPPQGQLSIECAWPAQEISHSRVEIAADLIRQAAAGAVELWPEPAPTH